MSKIVSVNSLSYIVGYFIVELKLLFAPVSLDHDKQRLCIIPHSTVGANKKFHQHRPEHL